MGIAAQIADLRARMGKARQNAPLAAPNATLLGASKGQSPEAIGEAIKAGLTLFGENRVQEAEGKWEIIKAAHPGVKLHLIGPLQTNKVKDALKLFDVIETIDRMKLADAIAEDSRAAAKEFYIQVNTGKEPQKSGAMPEDADALIAHCKKLGLNVAGLMCVPPADQPAAPHFALLREIAQRHGLKELSMGMSNDFETAIRMGSTCVRLGTAIFGERK